MKNFNLTKKEIKNYVLTSIEKIQKDSQLDKIDAIMQFGQGLCEKINWAETQEEIDFIEEAYEVAFEIRDEEIENECFFEEPVDEV